VACWVFDTAEAIEANRNRPVGVLPATEPSSALGARAALRAKLARAASFHAIGQPEPHTPNAADGLGMDRRPDFRFRAKEGLPLLVQSTEACARGLGG